MSVRKGDRKDGSLQVIEKMRELICYTHGRVKDNSIFPKSERWLLAKSIWSAASDAHSHILRANGIRVENEMEADERIFHEKLAIGCLDELIALIDICHTLKLISDDRADFWTGLATDAQNLAKGWLKSDRTRYRK